MFDRNIAACAVDHFIILTSAVLELDFIGHTTEVTDEFLEEAHNLGCVLIATVQDTFPEADPTLILTLTTILAINYASLVDAIYGAEDIEPTIFPSNPHTNDPLDLVRQKFVQLKIMDQPTFNTLSLNADFINSRLRIFSTEDSRPYIPSADIYQPLLGITSDTTVH